MYTWEQLKGRYVTFTEHHQVLGPPRFDRVIGALLKVGKLREVEVKPEKRANDRAYRPFVRYGWSKATSLDVAASLRPGSYFSHGTAAAEHGLLPLTTIYVNKEQSPKQTRGGVLTQEGIDRAFSNSPRVSTYVYVFEGVRIVLLSGKNTSDFEVVEQQDHSGVIRRYTSLERTLFDLTVRPVYAGGVSNVLKAFHEAKERVSVPKLVKVIKHLGHLYPYHQAVGFYLRRASYNETELEEFRQLPMQHNFYLANGMKKPKWDPEWRVFFPEDLPVP